MKLAVAHIKQQFGGWLPFLIAVLLGLVLARLSPVQGALLVGGTAVFLLTFIQPLIGLAVTLLLGPLGAWEALFLGPTPLDSGQILLLLTLAAWLARGLRDRRLTIPRTPLLLPLSLFAYVALLSLLAAPSFTAGLRELLKWGEIALVLLLVIDEASRLRQAHWYLLGALCLAGVTQAMLGIWQFGLRGDGPEHFLVLGRFYRAFGTFMQPNPFGGFMNLTLLLALGALAGSVKWVKWEERRGKREEGGERREEGGRWGLVWRPLSLVLAVVVVLTGVGLVASWSRGAWLGAVAGTAVLVLFFPQKRWHGIGLALIVGVAAVAVLGVGIYFNRLPTSIVERVTSSFSDDLRFDDVRGIDITNDNYAVLERLAHWQAALGMARDHVWLGVGFGNYEAAYPDYRLINWADALGHAHNYYLNLLAEVGVLGFLAYCLFWTAVFWQNILLLQRLEWPERGIALGLLAVWTALTVHHLVDKLYVNNIYVHLGVLLGLQQILWGTEASHS
ncbi:MAG: O-antigen ligase family protein [Chloroflexota bacterium]